MLSQNVIPSVNFHLWEPCNMRCGFCFARFQDVKQSVLPKGHLPQEQAVEVIQRLIDFSFEKITFAGGEPTLCPWLPELIQTAKAGGMTTMIVSNGSLLDPAYLTAVREHLDWVAISIDSVDPETNRISGRSLPGKLGLPDLAHYQGLTKLAQSFDIRLKINTVVHRYNWQERMVDFISEVSPERWKAFQVLPVAGQNDRQFERFSISDEEFQYFLTHNCQTGEEVPILEEDNSAMRGSYLMIDPAGRFFDNVEGKHRYSRPILEVGISDALRDVVFDYDRFVERGGLYKWG